MFSGMRTWQKGVFYSLIFVLAISIVSAIVLIAFDFIIEAKGLPHSCFLFVNGLCSFEQAVLSRLVLVPVLLLVFGFPTAVIAGLLGAYIERLKER
ncbi:MAG: hypothetical protein QXK37_04800 [Candidatus Woesearchaeota archaeon]